jgi:hypothetical protein
MTAAEGAKRSRRQLRNMARGMSLFLLYRFLEQLAGDKFGHLAGGDGNIFSRAGITPFASGAVDDLEAAETGKAYGFSGGKGVFQGGDNYVQGMFRLVLGGQTGFGMDEVDKFSFGHGAFPLSGVGGTNPRGCIAL